MPVATVDPQEYQRVELKTAPPDGFVMLRPLPFGMKLERRDRATRMSMEAQVGRNRGRRSNEEEQTQKFELETLNEWAIAYDFKYCIGDHNLTDVNGAQLDFNNPMILKLLNPRIGSELERLISEMNDEEDEETLEDFIKAHTSSSQEEPTKLSPA